MPFKKPRLLTDMSHNELTDMLMEIYEIAFTVSTDHGFEFNPDKSCGADEIAAVINVFAQHRLTPVEEP